MTLKLELSQSGGFIAKLKDGKHNIHRQNLQNQSHQLFNPTL